MISDVLFLAAEDISKYLNDVTWADMYGRPGEQPHDRIAALVEQMRVVQRDLDSPPAEDNNHAQA